MSKSANKPLKILIACGGTGGHLFPGIAVAECLRARGHDALLLISEKKVDSEASAKYTHLKFERVQAVAKPPTLSPRMLPFLWKLWHAANHSKKLIRSFGADAVLGMGGFTSLPPVYAGSKLGLKTFIHDSNARPGRSNVLTSRFCTQVFIGMEPAKAFFPDRETVLTGTPVRPEIHNLPSREEAAERFGLDPAKRTILVTGGSQGAQRLNELCAEAAAKLPEEIQVLHIAGAKDYPRVAEISASRPNCKVLGFCDQMPSAYALADLVVARSGASSLTEISLAGIPSILVPYPFAADDHQTRNAEVFANAGAAELIQQRDLTPEKLVSLTSSILNDLQTRERMAQAARALAVPDAADRVCAAIEATLAP
ncbi:undecaprenyldiphospho-muramoylpentapeptide beta-N-acetylglucosaminyltransferase [Luteolibacter pohnpeiensis]|uniref:UDP-N-acetylglucosamine--N-acetylmuramyl-(pentapeptide) pyrophosphoryl-undecaprenol N-acetylglucosamine transferase n=1 Tax=Luteolibacter pohnpeiensis TaxID=454153 RepID=A0A934S789_9BACT|nr:undecaprenyldiphospho-muramoylpentapeptide beta-N-acetylglucosaminyltransferase [Luteolibacter pohnpeiensis]MBK1883138.1 undecaprenyldiphospho-muramoylpentapeptide beta-N-acetylglucosaminyltransferase [Luteolibacter pohnpeiensis]